MNAALTERNAKAIQAGLEPARAALEAMCIKQLRAQSDRIAAKLEQHGGDCHAAYPYPSGMYSNYRILKAEYDLVRSITIPAPGAPCTRMGMHAPEPRIMRPDLAERQAAEARTFADGFIVTYAAKLAGKIAEADAAYEISTVNYTGSADPFSNSRLVLNGSNGGMVWNTRCIINVSKYGKLFNQWPTRKAA